MSLNHSRKHTLNEDFFLSWSSNMAYVLGFWFADGHIRKARSYRIVFSSNDESHLEDIKLVLESSAPITRYHRSRVPENCFRLNLHSKQLYHQILNLGGSPAKSLKLKFPNVPSEFLADYIRGFFDGDGSVFYVTYIRTKDKKRQVELRSNFTSGNREFLNIIRDHLSSRLGLFSRKICSIRNENSWKLGYGQKDTKKLLNYIYYPNHGISLKRKANFSDLPDL